MSDRAGATGAASSLNGRRKSLKGGVERIRTNCRESEDQAVGGWRTRAEAIGGERHQLDSARHRFAEHEPIVDVLQIGNGVQSGRDCTEP